MPYGIAIKRDPCPNDTVKGKHKWAFVKNGTLTRASFGAGGSSMRITLKGFYKCACGASRVGQPNHNAPGATLLAHE